MLQEAPRQENARVAALRKWLASLGIDGDSLAPASADASFRRYFRISTPGGTRIVMDAPPDKEDCRPYLKVAGLLRAAGINAPEIYAQDLEQGFLLITDLGRQTYLDVLTEANAPALFRDAGETLLKWQLASQPGVLPEYDYAVLRREADLFPDWYIARHLNVELTAKQKEVLDQVYRKIIESNLAQAKVYVHRDFMPRNLMHSDPNPGVIDFQDALYGPIGYDIACLYRDAFISWEEELILDGTIRYWEKAKKAGLPVPADFGDFYRDVEWMALQRHLKVAGIFARINYRDGKPHYLTDTPRFIRYIRKACERYEALTPLLRLLDELKIGEPTPSEYRF